MIPIKIQCGCGQRYAFDVEPVHGRMPSAVACPVCGADGTDAANAMIAQSLPIAPPPPTAAPAGVRLSMPAHAPGPAAPAAASFTAPGHAAAEDEDDDAPSSKGKQWKWWYFILAGIGIGGYSIWQAYDQHRIKPLGELFFAVLCIAIGIWDFQHQRAKKRMRQ